MSTLDNGLRQEWLRLTAENARLRKGIQDYLDGNYPHPRRHRGELGNCKHGQPWYNECGQCDEDHFTALLTNGER